MNERGIRETDREKFWRSGLSQNQFCQQEIVELVNIKFERGERELHIVAPPGASGAE
jgi:hypothetical protein